MECAPHRMWKKLMALVLSLVMMAVMLPGALAVDLNVDAGFYFKQSRGGTCTLASAAMMLRRRAFLDGLTDWTDVTENSVRGSAWSGGLAHSFNYNAMQVGYATLPSGTEAKKQTLIQLLAEHPEGIVLYDRSRPHAVLLTDYTDGVFYCSDPAGSVSLGRVPISAASISIAGASCYWYITSDQNSVTALPDSLRLEGMHYPVNIRTGKGMSVSGIAAGGQLHLHGLPDGLQWADPLLHERLHGVRQRQQHRRLLVGAGSLRLEGEPDRSGGRSGSCRGSGVWL